MLDRLPPDVDHFTAINERYGHGYFGDRLMALLPPRAGPLRSWAGGDDVAARASAATSSRCCCGTATLRESHHAVERVLRQIAQPCDIGPTKARSR